MPFKRADSDTKSSQPTANGHTIFTGRTNELEFFVQDILKPEEPAYNIISVSGNGGVGKSTLLSMFLDRIHSHGFRAYCLAALVNEQQTIPATIMEQFANQLRQQGYPLSKFESELAHYKETLRKHKGEGGNTQETLARKAAPELVGAVVKDVPVVGGILEKGTGLAVEYILDELDNRQLHKDMKLLEDPIHDLTKAFVDDLNRVTDRQITLHAQPKKHGWRLWSQFSALVQRLFGPHRTQGRKVRVILFFDTFERLAAEGAPWMLDHFLKLDISSDVVLVVAGREPITRSFPEDPKRWLTPHFEGGPIYSIPLESFTEEETRSYLVERGITEPKRISTIWQLSRGLPLYLGLLTSSLQGDFDPTSDVVANFLRWIPKQDSLKRRLVLDVALFSRPFNQDDVAALPYFPTDLDQQISLYQWLVGLPFVSSNFQDGRYHYHELAQEMFSRHLYSNSPKEYYATRNAIANYYSGLLEQNRTTGSKGLYTTAQWLELTLALIYQLFLLQDEEQHIKAIEQVLRAYEHTLRSGDIIRLLRELSQEKFTTQISPDARQIATQLLEYLTSDLESPNYIPATSALLEQIAQRASFSPQILAQIYRNRGRAYRESKEYRRAIEDFDHALQLNPNYAWAYSSRGTAYRLLGEYHRAIADFNSALKLDPNYVWAYIGRGTTYRLLKEYQRATVDFDRAFGLDTQNVWVYSLRGETYQQLKEYDRAINDYNRVIELDPQAFWTYGLRGIAYASLREYERAIEDFTRVLDLSPQSTWARELRDEASRLLNIPKQNDQGQSPFAQGFIPPSPSAPSSAPASPASPTYGVSDRAGGVILEGLTQTMLYNYNARPSYPPVTPPVTPTSPGPIRYLSYRGHSKEVLALAWSPDGKYLASGSLDKTVQVWEAGTGKLMKTYRGHSAGVDTVAWSPDGKYLASGSLDKTVQMWEASTGKLRRTFQFHSNTVRTVALSPDGKRLASGSLDATVMVLDTATGKLLWPYQRPADGVNAVVWSPDGTQIASAWNDGMLYVLDATTGQTTFAERYHGGKLNAVDWSPKRKLGAFSGDSGSVVLSGFTPGSTVWGYNTHANSLLALAWSPDGTRIVSTSDSGTAEVWDVTLMKNIVTYHIHSAPVHSVVWSPDGTSIASASDDKTVQVWKAPRS